MDSSPPRAARVVTGGFDRVSSFLVTYRSVTYSRVTAGQEERCATMKKQRLTAADRRVQLMDVGRAVFAAGGYEGTALDELAARAGVTKPVIYEHFGAKEGLYA